MLPVGVFDFGEVEDEIDGYDGDEAEGRLG